MASVSDDGYVVRRTSSCKPNQSKATYREWYLIKAIEQRTKKGVKFHGQIQLSVFFKEKWIGKKIRIKIEEV